jgi:hypothetical protein
MSASANSLGSATPNAGNFGGQFFGGQGVVQQQQMGQQTGMVPQQRNNFAISAMGNIGNSSTIPGGGGMGGATKKKNDDPFGEFVNFGA